MYIRPSSLRNKRSEDQLISELIDVFKRHDIKCGDPQDLAHLGSDLVSHDEFRNDLFSRCNVISHMSQAGLSPEQLLVITAQALGGPGITKPDGTVEIPHITRSAFLIGYEIWIKEGDEEESSQTSITRQAFNTPSLTARSESDLRGGNGSHNGAHNGFGADHQPGPVSPSTPLDSLTLNQLKRYIEDIEGRINRIEPQLGQMPARSHSSAELIDRLRFLETQNGHSTEQTMPDLAAGPSNVHGLNSAFGMESPQSRGVVQRKVLPSIGPLAAPPPSAPIVAATATAVTSPFQPAPSPAPATSPIYHLRVAIGALSFLLILAIVSAAILAYRNMHPETNLVTEAPQPAVSPAQPATQFNPSSASAATAFSATAPSRSAPSTSTPGPAPVKQAPPNSGDTRSATKQPAPANQTVAPPAKQPPARSNSQPPVQQPARSTSQQSSPAPAQPQQAPAASPANSSPAPAPSVPAAQGPASANVAASNPRPELAREEPPARAASPPPASAPVTASRPPETAAAAPVTRPTQAPSGPLSVPSATMMRYAVATPPPAFPKNRFSRPDDIVVIQATISANGAVTGTRTLSGPPDLRPAVTQAMQAWHFKPYVVDGTPVEVVTTFNFAFKTK